MSDVFFCLEICFVLFVLIFFSNVVYAFREYFFGFSSIFVCSSRSFIFSIYDGFYLLKFFFFSVSFLIVLEPFFCLSNFSIWCLSTSRILFYRSLLIKHNFLNSSCSFSSYFSNSYRMIFRIFFFLFVLFFQSMSFCFQNFILSFFTRLA